ncbi:MAG: VOC family protein [Candidatus Binatia bacterium]|nr:VOC family protein [Candidatus Binatia bacterium]
MSFHHLALVTRDTKATHEFYSVAMGFTLAKVEVGATPEGGWAKHFFYETGGNGMIAFWEIHDETTPAEHPTAIAGGLGLPVWSNHLAFTARDRDELDAHRKRWVEHGHDVAEVDHEWCVSIYTLDPNGIMVEFCLTTRAFTAAEQNEAEHLLQDPAPPVPKVSPPTKVYRAAASD